jgi:required for meiotic nuclear division protein 1
LHLVGLLVNQFIIIVMENVELFAINISDRINLKQLKSNFEAKLIIATPVELFFKKDNFKYISFFNFGIVVFSNHTKSEIKEIVESIGDFTNEKQKHLSENLLLNFGPNKNPIYENDVLIIPDSEIKDEIFRIVMFNLSQTVAVDGYATVADLLLQEVKIYAFQLSRNGKISLSKRNMMKFIGRSLFTRNKIVDNIFIFDSPDIAWEDEMVEKVHKLMVQIFDLNIRLREMELTFNVIDTNLQVFNESYEHRYSSFLEIVVIILIFIEILNSLVDRFW